MKKFAVGFVLLAARSSVCEGRIGRSGARCQRERYEGGFGRDGRIVCRIA
jgi:hypothetical protein